MPAAKKAAKTAVGAKVAKGAARAAGKAALGGGKAQAKLARQALGSQESAGSRYLKYGLFAVVGFAVGALVARAGNREDALSYTGETWGGGGPSGSTAGTGSDPAAPSSFQRPEGPNSTGTGREYSDPSAGPLIGRSHAGRIGDVPVQEEETENRIRTRVGEDPRTSDVPHLNVEVNDGVADIRGQVHSDEEKQAVEEIASSVEGVIEVHNLLTVNPNAPRRRDRAGGDGPASL
ncbi:hypothetical protein BH24ACT19_BH24ACT19_04930 [soil metagenome]